MIKRISNLYHRPLPYLAYEVNQYIDRLQDLHKLRQNALDSMAGETKAREVEKYTRLIEIAQNILELMLKKNQARLKR